MNHLETGKLGEDIAEKYLEDKGYKIIERNYRTKYAEIDLIAQADDIMVFIEVRTKTSDKFGLPEETINKKKINKLKRNALAYTAWKRWKGVYQIDVIGVVLNQNHTINRIQHYENIA